MNLKRFSVATFNLYNLNLPGLPLYRSADGWSQAQYDRKIEWAAQQLRGLDADLVGFQELWHREALEAVVKTAGVLNDFDLLVPRFADGTKIVCAAMVRKGLLDTGIAPSWIDAFPRTFRLESQGDDDQASEVAVRIDAFARPVLAFTVRLRDDHEPVRAYVCHLKSKAPTRIDQEEWYRRAKPKYAPHATAIGAALSTVRRTAEATALRMILTEVMKTTDTPVIVLGDVNDGQHSNTLNIITEQPRYLVGGSLGGGSNVLYTAQTLQEYRDSRDVYYTHVHQDLRESLDHVLVSEQFYDNSRRRLWLFDGLIINNDHLNRDEHKVDGTTDHGIVRVQFKHAPARP